MDQATKHKVKFQVHDDHGRIHAVHESLDHGRQVLRTSDGHDVMLIEGGNVWIVQLQCFAHRMN